MKINFTEPRKSFPNLLADVSVEFEDPDFAGCVLTGFSIRKDKDGEIYTGVPAREYMVGDEKRYWNLIRYAEGADKAATDAFRQKITDAYHAQA